MDSDNIKEILDVMGREEVPVRIQALAERAADRFRRNPPEPRARGVFLFHSRIAKGAVVKLTVAAAIILTVLTAIGHIGGRNATWAKVVRNVEQALTYTCDLTVTTCDPNRETISFKAAVYVRSGGGERQAVCTYKIQACTLSVPKGRTDVRTMPAEKREPRDIVSQVDLQVRYALKDMQRLIKDLLIRDRKKLAYYDLVKGRFAITGIRNLQLLSATFPVRRATAQLWADTETDFPLRVEATVKGKNGEKLTLKAEKFVWNVPLDPRIFDANTSEDESRAE